MPNSSVNGSQRQPSNKAKLPKKPKKDFPLYAHRAGRWAKKVLGRTVYFTRWDEDPKGKAALDQWLDQKDALLAGREPRSNTGKLTLYDLCHVYLKEREQQLDSGDIKRRTFADDVRTCERTCKVLGKHLFVEALTPADFRKLRANFAKTCKAVALGNNIQRVRSLFLFAYDEGLIDRPIRYGKSFKKPSKAVVRREREEHRSLHGDRMFEAHELRLLLDALDGKEVTLSNGDEPTAIRIEAKPQLRAIILLAANCGFGQTDIAELPARAINLKTGWLDFPRPKNAITRKIPLWPETVAALKKWLPLREAITPEDKADKDLLFLTTRGMRWVKVKANGSGNKASINDALGQEFNKLLRKLGLKRPRVSFYAIRHGFETIGGESIDQVAVDAIMGHAPEGMAGVYRERISDERLQKVVEFVRAWLFSKGGEQ